MLFINQTPERHIIYHFLYSLQIVLDTVKSIINNVTNFINMISLLLSQAVTVPFA
jgi:hypothetical protein